MRFSDGEVLFLWPLSLHVITAGWLYSDRSVHHALDFRASVGTPVYASEAGTVDWVQTWDGKTKTGNQSYGNLIRITHKAYAGKRLQTYYAHLSSVSIKSGQAVAEGQLIGYTGNSGNSTGPHLHYEVRLGGNRVNPLNWLDGDFSKAYSYVILGNYTSVERPKQKGESNMTYTSDTLKIGPVSGGDRSTLKDLADGLGLGYEDQGDYLIVGPMSAGDRSTVAAKAQALALGCVDYFEPEKPQNQPQDTVQVDLTQVLDRLDSQDKVLAEISENVSLILDKLAAAGKALG